MNNAALQQQKPDTEYHTDIPVGEILRRTRVHYNQSLMEVESALRIRGSQLNAIEEGDFAAMPGRVYAIGFVRSYSEYLRLDGDKMVELFKTQYAAFSKRPSLNFPVTLAESKLPSPYIILGSLSLGILFIAVLAMFVLPDYQKEIIPVVPDELIEAKLPTIAPEPEEVLQEEEGFLPSLVDSSKVELVIIEKSWTDIRNGEGEPVLRQILKPGEKYTVPDKAEGFTLATGNAGGITVYIGGENLGVLGDGAQVKRNIPLNAKELREYFSKD